MARYPMMRSLALRYKLSLDFTAQILLKRHMYLSWIIDSLLLLPLSY